MEIMIMNQAEKRNLVPFVETKENSATHCMYTDSHAYEIIRYCTPRKIIVRQLHAERDTSVKLEFIPGGFCGHTVNQHEQRWFLFHDPERTEVAIRLNKKGQWKDKHGGRFVLGRATEFYDYNF